MQNYKSPRDITSLSLKYLWILSIISVFVLNSVYLTAQDKSCHSLRLAEQSEILTGAQQIEKYLPLLSGKSIGVVCNQSSLIGKVHLIDTLLSSGIIIKAVFAPEHGFLGNAAAGTTINDTTDIRTKLKVISLYGNKKKPEPGDLQEIEIMLFDIQDVGTRFYTYISTLALVMEACAEQGIPLIILDRPNPNAFYIDGPVLDTAYRSFVGLHPVPIVYGMTIGEYAMLVNGEGWLRDSVRCDLTVVTLQKWDRNMIINLAVRPSPNLQTWQAIYLYPSLCLFEGTVMSVGRGTDLPFQVIGHPEYLTGSYAFIPQKIPGVAEKPPYEGQQCFGQNLTSYADNFLENHNSLNLAFLINSWKELNLEEDFFNSYFDKLAGGPHLREQILAGESEEMIRNGWKAGLDLFREIRKKYLLYPDN
jgi:uncharacterized protein YbbC (DUF1343 family)